MQIRWLKHPLGGPMIELIRYLHHEAGPAAHNSRVGAAHLCLAVEDVRAAYTELSPDGITFLSDPTKTPTASSGCTFAIRMATLWN